MEAFGLDVGGSGVKGAPIDARTGELLAERHRVPTPEPATPEAVVGACAEVISHFGWNGPVGCGFPAVIKEGRPRTAANIHETNIGFDLRGALSEATGCSVEVVNDADAAGLAESRWGAGRDVEGLVLMLTLGTGIGTALLMDGRLVPNTELGHVQMRGMEAEHYASDGVRKSEDLGWENFAGRFDEYLSLMESLLWPDLIIVGGGASKKAHKFFPHLSTRAPIVPAELLNSAGISGAALAAVPGGAGAYTGAGSGA